MAQGYTKSQARGHPKAGELSVSQGKMRLPNPFKKMRESIKGFISQIQSLFGGGTTLPAANVNEVEYTQSTGEYGINSIPRWSIGSDNNPASIQDIRVLFDEVYSYRGGQKTYTMIVCGILEETYPGHSDTDIIECVSYRVRAHTINVMMKRGPTTSDEFVNNLLPEDHDEHWLQVNEVQIIDKE